MNRENAGCGWSVSTTGKKVLISSCLFILVGRYTCKIWSCWWTALNTAAYAAWSYWYVLCNIQHILETCFKRRSIWESMGNALFQYAHSDKESSILSAHALQNEVSMWIIWTCSNLKYFEMFKRFPSYCTLVKGHSHPIVVCLKKKLYSLLYDQHDYENCTWNVVCFIAFALVNLEICLINH